LRAYPRDLLRSPLDVTSAAATLAPTTDAPPTLLSGRALAAPDRVEGSRYAALVERQHLSLLVALGSLALAVFWGAAHALSHGHHHHHQHDHDHDRRSLVAIGISGGLLPCPSALVVLLAAISLHRVAFGMLLVVAFSVGLAVSITCVGLVAVLAKRAFARFDG